MVWLYPMYQYIRKLRTFTPLIWNLCFSISLSSRVSESRRTVQYWTTHRGKWTSYPASVRLPKTLALWFASAWNCRASELAKYRTCIVQLLRSDQSVRSHSHETAVEVPAPGRKPNADFQLRDVGGFFSALYFGGTFGLALSGVLFETLSAIRRLLRR